MTLTVDFDEWGLAELMIAVGGVAFLVALAVWVTRRRWLSVDEQQRRMETQFDGRDLVACYTFHWSLSEAHIREIARRHGYQEVAPQPGQYGPVLRFARPGPPR